jgi:hypothetical protein
MQDVVIENGETKSGRQRDDAILDVERMTLDSTHQTQADCALYYNSNYRLVTLSSHRTSILSTLMTGLEVLWHLLAETKTSPITTTSYTRTTTNLHLW